MNRSRFFLKGLYLSKESHYVTYNRTSFQRFSSELRRVLLTCDLTSSVISTTANTDANKKCFTFVRQRRELDGRAVVSGPVSNIEVSPKP